MNGLWDLPALKGQGLLTAIAGGWQICCISRYKHRPACEHNRGSGHRLDRREANNRNSGPGHLTDDISVNKSLPLFDDKGRLTFRADLFNVLNWTNLNAPDRIEVSRTFGQIRSAGDGGDQRIAQFALRYDF